MGSVLPRRGAVVLLVLSGCLLDCSDETNPYYVSPPILFPDSVVAYAGHELDTVKPSLLKNVEVDSYTVSPALPEPLRFDSRTGAVWGMPPARPGRTTHTLYGHNRYGSSDGEVFALIVCPAEPRGVRVALLRPDSVRLVWNAVEGAGAYDVLRARSVSGPFVSRGVAADTFFVDRSDLKTDSVYFYRVRAQSSETLPSLPSETVSATIPSHATLPSPQVTILSPSRDTLVRDSVISVRYEIDALVSSRLVRLVEGVNLVVVDSTNGAGKRGADTVTITLDRTPPARPVVSGVTPTNDRTPTWQWRSGGGGRGIFRYRLDTTDVAGGTETRDTAFTPAMPLDTGRHTLYVQERDSAGNWSPPAWFDIVVDITPPSAPLVTGPAVTADSTPTWTWVQGPVPGAGVFRCKLDDPDLSAGAFATLGTSYTCSTAVTNGPHRLYVQERDEAGNWSAAGSFAILVDLVPPNPPVVSAPRATNRLRPTWTWRSGGGDGAAGRYRWRLDNQSFASTDSGSAVLSYTPGSDLAQGNRVLYVQERDTLGNWSVPAACTVGVLPHVTFVDSAARAMPADGSTWENAFRTISAATAGLAAGNEVWVARGTYVVTGLTVAGRLRGGFTGTERDTVRDWVHNLSVMNGNGTQNMLTIGAGALVEAFVIRDGMPPSDPLYRLMRVSGGTLRRCVVRDCGGGEMPSISCCGEGTVDACVTLGELVELCGNGKATMANSIVSGIIRIEGSMVSIVNSTLFRTTIQGYSAGGSRLANCALSAAGATNPPSIQSSCVPDSSLACLGAGNVVGDPCFVGPLPANPLSLPDSIWFTSRSPLMLDTARSPCCNRGQFSATGPAADIRGRPRPATLAEQAANPIDMGAYEQ